MARRLALPVLILLASCGTRKVAPLNPQPEAAPPIAIPVDGARATPPQSDAGLDAGVAPSADAGPVVLPESPPRVRKVYDRAVCAGVGDVRSRHHVADVDLRSSFVDGDDLLALVNRSPTGGLSPDYVPGDLVDIRTLKKEKFCDAVQCLRLEAATALKDLLAVMKTQGFQGRVESAYRSYFNQCGTFLNWAKRGFCDATEQSALPGHSQHQLGTTVDLFTEEWAKDPRGVFREGFGCSPAGRWLREHAWESGFVMSYPLHPDDEHARQTCAARSDIPVGINPRTGYRYEHWHFRYIGKEAAKEWFDAYTRSGPREPGAVTLEQWLRRKKGLLDGDAELPVCDGCNCGACATLAGPAQGPCKGNALAVGSDGVRLSASGPPSIVKVEPRAASAGLTALEVTVRIPEGTVTQPPLETGKSVFYNSLEQTFESVTPFPDTRYRGYPDLARAVRVAVRSKTDRAYPWRFGLAHADDKATLVYNRANVPLPAKAGERVVKVTIPLKGEVAVVALIDGGKILDTREVTLP